METNNNNVPQDQPAASAHNHRTGNVPAADANLLSLAQLIAAKWSVTASLSLLWTNPAQFQENVSGFDISLHTKNATGGSRNSITDELVALNKQINSDVEHIKAYLAEKYTKKNAPVHYASFGITKVGSAFKLPADHQKRKDALALMLEAIETEGFSGKTYGKAHWTDIKNRFDALMSSAGEADGTISQHVGLKKQYKAEIRKALNAIVHLIKANYPDSFKAELRTWGFRKERY